MKKGKLLVISGFSGVGKGTVVNYLKEHKDTYKVSVSVTTREPRPNEIPGVHYHYISNEQFETMINENKLLEYAGYVDHYYGTPREFVEENLNSGNDVILEIETKGALQVKKNMPEAILIFILPPSADELRKRLVGRNTETEEVINDRLKKAAEETDNMDSFKVSGRGELHLSVLIENMRREGYEFAVSKAEVLYKTDERGKKLEPMERAFVDVPEEFAGSVIEKLSTRKGELQGMGSIGGGFTRLEFVIPSRGLIGYRGEFMTDTKGNGILNTVFEDYGPYKGDIAYRKQGSLIAFESGETVAYGLFNAQDRGTLFVGPGEKVYAGMVIGQNGKTEDIELNVCKTKHLTNTRSSSADDALKLTPPKVLSLEEALEFIDTDELLEITPENLRIRKKILDPTLRFRAKKNATNG